MYYYIISSIRNIPVSRTRKLLIPMASQNFYQFFLTRDEVIVFDFLDQYTVDWKWNGIFIDLQPPPLPTMSTVCLAFFYPFPLCYSIY